MYVYYIHLFSPINPLIHLYKKKPINIGLQRAHSPTLEEETNKYVTFYDIFSNVISRKPITKFLYVYNGWKRNEFFLYIAEWTITLLWVGKWKKKSLYCIFIYIYIFLCIDGKREEKKEKKRIIIKIEMKHSYKRDV